MNISNMSATFIRSDRVLYWRDVKRLIRDRRERVPSRSHRQVSATAARAPESSCAAKRSWKRQRRPGRIKVGVAEPRSKPISAALNRDDPGATVAAAIFQDD